MVVRNTRYHDYFTYSIRLGIDLPVLAKDWASYTLEEREMIITNWEQIRGQIPNRIKAFEAIIEEKQQQLNHEPDFAVCCALNAEIAEYASRINDLHIWFRLNENVSVNKNHG